jgi:hypothetical protein
MFGDLQDNKKVSLRRNIWSDVTDKTICCVCPI